MTLICPFGGLTRMAVAGGLLTLVGCALSAPRCEQISARRPDAVTGSAFRDQILKLTPAERETHIFREIVAGNIPAFLRSFVAVTVQAEVDGVPHVATYQVASDYLAVGSDDDFFRVPMRPGTAQAIADRFDCVLPTRKMVNDIYAQAAIKLAPSPISPKSTDITQVATFYQHQLTIEQQRQGRPLGLLVAGIKKDVVVTPQLRTKPGKVAIYGWHQLNGVPIQPLYLGHVDTWVDYSHGIRLVKRRMLLDGKPATVDGVLGDAKLCVLLSDEGTPCRYSVPQNMSGLAPSHAAGEGAASGSGG